jgi:hypothetical protein
MLNDRRRGSVTARCRRSSVLLGLSHPRIDQITRRRHRATRVRPPCPFVLEFFRAQRIGDVPGLGHHFVSDGLAVFGGQAVGCPSQQIVDLVFHVGHDFVDDGFPEVQFAEPLSTACIRKEAAAIWYLNGCAGDAFDDHEHVASGALRCGGFNYEWLLP